MSEMFDKHLHDATLMRWMLFGPLLSKSLCVVVELDVPDLLAGSPRPLAEIAAETGTDPVSLRRLLRGLAMFDVFEEPEEGVFALAPLGRTLCRNAVGSARPSALLVSGVVGTTWAAMDRTVRTGRPVFDELFGTDFFDYLDDNPEVARIFSASQAEGLVLELDEILGVADFSPYRTIVDVGGGDGAFLTKLLNENPQARGILFELTATATLGAKRIAAQGLAERCEVVAGDFFDGVPAGGDAYLLSHVLHDWSDADAARILRSCARAVPAHGTLIVVDLITAEYGSGDSGYEFAGLLDLYMLSLFGGAGGHERNASEFTGLLESAGFADVRIRRLPSGMGFIEARPG